MRAVIVNRAGCRSLRQCDDCPLQAEADATSSSLLACLLACVSGSVFSDQQSVGSPDLEKTRSSPDQIAPVGVTCSPTDRHHSHSLAITLNQFTPLRRTQGRVAVRLARLLACLVCSPSSGCQTNTHTHTHTPSLSSLGHS